MLSDLTWNTFRDHWILEYEIPKFDGDLGTPNCFVPLDRDTCQRKVEYLQTRVRQPTGQALVHRRDLHGSDAAAGYGVPRARRLCRGLLRAQDGIAAVTP